MRSLSSLSLAVVLFAAFPAAAAGSCDVAGADAAALASAYASIDAACPCAAAASVHAYRRCVRNEVAALVSGSSLPATCRRDARRYASRTVCGFDAAVVCCRVDANGRARHRIFRDAGKCVDRNGYVACTSEWHNTVVGCDATGCVPPVVPVCGNSIVEEGEECDPPSPVCDATCHAIPPACGNLVVEIGEACEPPGIGSCGRDCQAAACTAPATGETDVTCVEGATKFSAAASSSGYLLAWSGPAQRENEILALRLDADAVVADTSLSVASSESPDGINHSFPSAASDTAGFYLVWSAYGPVPGYPSVIEQTIRGRRFGATSGAEATDVLVSNIPFGYCRANVAGPTAAAAAGPSLYTATWQIVSSCGGGVLDRDPDGAFLDVSSVPTTTSAPLGFPLATALPATMSTSPATMASLAGNSLWAWHAKNCDANYSCVPFVAAAWSDGTATGSPFPLSSTNAPLTSPPAVSAGPAAWLVAWSQQNGDATASEIRAVRVTRAGGPLDPDGGLLLATVPNGISGGPSVAFDGSRWLVAWTQASVAYYEVKAVALNTDGSVVGPSPRTVAADVATAAPSAAATGDGRVLVVFARDDATHTAIRATLVTP